MFEGSWETPLRPKLGQELPLFIASPLHPNHAAIICLTICYSSLRASLVAQTVKHLFEMKETRVQSLGREDPLEKEMAPHSSTLAWKIPWTEEPGGLQSMGSQRVGHD